MVSGGGLLAAATCKPRHTGHLCSSTCLEHTRLPISILCQVLNLLALQDQLPPLMASKEAGSKHLAQIQHQQSEAQQAVTDLKRDTDILINAFLKEEKRVWLWIGLLGAASDGCRSATNLIRLCCRLQSFKCCTDALPASVWVCTKPI